MICVVLTCTILYPHPIPGSHHHPGILLPYPTFDTTLSRATQSLDLYLQISSNNRSIYKLQEFPSIQTVLHLIRIPVIMITVSWHRLILIMLIPTLLIRRPYMETTPWISQPFFLCNRNSYTAKTASLSRTTQGHHGRLIFTMRISILKKAVS